MASALESWNAGSIEGNGAGVTSASVPPRWVSPREAAPTHTSAAVAATVAGRPPTRSVETTLLRRGSIRETVPAYVFATQTDPAAVVIADGPLPTGIVATTEPVLALILETVASRLFATQSALSSSASALGPWPTETVAIV